MVTVRTIFQAGVMDKDSDKSLIKTYRKAENLRFYTNDGDDGIGNNIKGSLLVSDYTVDQQKMRCILALYDEKRDSVFYWLASEGEMYNRILEYDKNGVTHIILDDSQGKLKFNYNSIITGANIIDDFIIFSEWGNNIRKVNIERARNYGLNNFNENDIKLIVRPPLNKLKIKLSNSDSIYENNLKEVMYHFSYRYLYLDNEYSKLVPFTNVAFFPKKFNYNFATQSNESMVNMFNQVEITFNTGGKLVKEIQLVFIESNSLVVNVIDDFNKKKLNYVDNEDILFKFSKDKTYRVLSSNVLKDSFSNVPLSAKSQTVIDGRLIIANYKENYKIEDDLQNEIEINYSLRIASSDINGLLPEKSCKSNRDLEVGIVYLDEDMRSTTVLIGKESTIHIPSSLSTKKNEIIVDLKSKVPYFAKYYRFFIKQAYRGYEIIMPVLFYVEGAYRWIRLEGADKDKIKKGDYLVVKSDTSGIINSIVKTKVLEVDSKERNFLQPANVVDTIKELPGVYFKIKDGDGFKINPDDFSEFKLSTYDSSRKSHNNPIIGLSPKTSRAHFYGDTLNDMSASSGLPSLSSGESKRFIIEIDSVTGAFDTFRWKEVNDPSFLLQNSNIQISGVALPQPLSNNVYVTFLNNTGHSINDNWTVNSRGVWNVLRETRSYGFFRTAGFSEETINDYDDESIQAGAVIELEYDEYVRGNTYFKIQPPPSSRRYDNIEEWYHGENIKNIILSEVPSFDLSSIHFVRGILYSRGAGSLVQHDKGFMTMVIRSMAHGVSVGLNNRLVKTRTTTVVKQSISGNNLIFETEAKEQPKDVYYEIGETYPVVDGYHKSNIIGDTSQSVNTDLSVKLDWFNCFSFGNGVESYKIRDEFNSKSLSLGIRISSVLSEKYTEQIVKTGIAWSDIYKKSYNINGLSDFNLSDVNYIELDISDGDVQKMVSLNGNIIVFQSDSIGVLPYNKNIIQGTDNGKVVGISKDVLDKKSYRSYGSGLHGVSDSPESIVVHGDRIYAADKQRGDLIRLSRNGITTINQNGLEHDFSNEMIANKNNLLVAGYDPKHGEYILSLPNSNNLLVWKEKSKGFPNYYQVSPDYILGANNNLFMWKDGVMYKTDETNSRNSMLGSRLVSKIVFFQNISPDKTKVLHSISLESSHAFDVWIKTKLGEAFIPKEYFEKKEDFWYSEVMGNTNGVIEQSSYFGLGHYPIVNGKIVVKEIPSTLSIGDFINGYYSDEKIIDIKDNVITIENSINKEPSLLVYSKDQNIDGSDMRGDVFEVEMTSDTDEKLELRAVNFNFAES